MKKFLLNIILGSLMGNTFAGSGPAKIKCISLSGRSHFEAEAESLNHSFKTTFEIDSVTMQYGSSLNSYLILDPQHKVLTLSQSDTINGIHCAYKFYAIPASWDAKVDKAHHLDVEFKAVLRGSDPRTPKMLSPIVDMTCTLKWNL